MYTVLGRNQSLLQMAPTHCCLLAEVEVVKAVELMSGEESASMDQQ
jgi:hypothetical protein